MASAFFLGNIFGKLGLAGLTIGVAARMLVPAGDLPAAVVADAEAATATATASKDAAAKTLPVSRVLDGLPAKWPLTGGGTTPSAPTAPVLAPLAPLDLSSTWLWNWAGKWIGSEWSNGNSPLPWKFDHIRQLAKADTVFTLDTSGAPQLQGGGATPAYTDGLWETDVTLPQLREGMVVAPLWLYDPASRDEIDFEFAGRRGLDVSMHSYVNGQHIQNTVRLFAGTDMSGQRKRFGIKVDQKAGFVEMFVDGARVHRWDRATTRGFVAKPLKPWIEMWAASPANAGFVYWVGKWTPLAAGQSVTMRVHGYGYTAPATAAASLAAAGKTGSFALD